MFYSEFDAYHSKYSQGCKSPPHVYTSPPHTHTHTHTLQSNWFGLFEKQNTAEKCAQQVITKLGCWNNVCCVHNACCPSPLTRSWTRPCVLVHVVNLTHVQRRDVPVTLTRQSAPGTRSSLQPRPRTTQLTWKIKCMTPTEFPSARRILSLRISRIRSAALKSHF